MKNWIYIFILFQFYSMTSVSAQDTKLLFREGHILFKREHYRKALPYLERVVEAEPENAEALFETGVCYLHRYSKEKALTYLLKAYALDSNKTKHIHFWLGRAYHQNYEYDKAIGEYNFYKQNLTKADTRRRDVDKYIKQTKTARELTSNPENYKVINLGPVVNTLYSEHSPVSSRNDSTLLFTSRRNDVTGGKEDLDGEFFEDIFKTDKLSSGAWSSPVKIPFNTSGHDASIQLFDNDSKLLLYRQAKGGDIYVSEKDPVTGAWKDPVKFLNLNSPDFEADAFVAADGKTIYFATNHFKKTGDLDIYFVTRNQDGTWSAPKEPIGKINTYEDETAPFLAPDAKTFYFSSRGHRNMGGFDVFRCTLDSNGKWSDPVNIGYPINTPDDDVYFYLISSGKKGYFASYREGGYGEKDIYEVRMIPPVFLHCSFNTCTTGEREELNYSVRSLRNTTRKVILNGTFRDNMPELKLYADNAFRLTIYNIKDTLYSETIDLPYTEEQNTVVKRNITLPCPEAGTPVAYEYKYLFRNIFFEKGRSEIIPSSLKELQLAAEVLKKNPSAVVQLRGYSQPGESPELAMLRAQVVQERLKALGVVNEMEVAVASSVKDGPEGRSVVPSVKFRSPLNTDFDAQIIAPSEAGTSFILRKIYFETAMSSLNPEAKAELDVLSQILKEHSGLRVEVAGHTDAEGSEEINPRLSLKRAEMAAEYLVQKGVQKDRLLVKGYGKTQPVGDNNTEAGRRINRRVEFRILK